jgi:hypothetical protein
MYIELLVTRRKLNKIARSQRHLARNNCRYNYKCVRERAPYFLKTRYFHPHSGYCQLPTGSRCSLCMLGDLPECAEQELDEDM